MIYRTLIIFDTNRVRHTDYVGFKIGGDYDVIREFIKNNNLGELIHIALPEFVLEEIKKQKLEQYEKDIAEFGKIMGKFEKLGVVTGKNEIKFDIEKYLDNQIGKYLEDQNLKLIKIPKSKYETILESIIQRAISKKLPFKRNDRHSDMGFKDVLIWETVLNSRGLILDYDNIFYCSGDNGFNECKEEFEKIINRNFEQFNEGGYLMERLEGIYFDLIRNVRIYQFVRTEYFKEILEQKIEGQHWVEVDGEDKEIDGYEIIEVCNQIVRKESGDAGELWFEITSQLLIKIDGVEKDFFALTIVNDTNEVISFEIEDISGSQE